MPLLSRHLLPEFDNSRDAFDNGFERGRIGQSDPTGSAERRARHYRYAAFLEQSGRKHRPGIVVSRIRILNVDEEVERTVGLHDSRTPGRAQHFKGCVAPALVLGLHPMVMTVSGGPND